MAKFTFNLPDIGEGIAEAEIVAWHVSVGDMVEEDQQIADMMTDKATVEMESPVAGKILEVAGDVGDTISIDPMTEFMQNGFVFSRHLDDKAGVAALPRACRPGIFAARHVYAGIGHQVRRAGYDSVTRRAMTSTRQKLGWLSLAMLRAGTTYVMPRSAMIYARPLPECAFLVEAAAARAPQRGDWSDTLYVTMAQLKARDAGRGFALIDGDAGDRYRA